MSDPTALQRHARRTLSAALCATAAGLLLQTSAHAFIFGSDDVAGDDDDTALESVDVDALARRELSGDRDEIRARFLFAFKGTAALDAFEDYANEVAQRLLARTRLPDDLDIEVQVLAKASALASVSSDGTIWLGHAWLDQLDNEDQLAFVLAHEIGHIAFNHHASDWMQDSVVYAAHAVRLYDETTDDVDREDRAAVDAACAITQDIIFPAFSREQELEADRFALDAVVAAGYNPRPYQGVMDVLGAGERPGAASFCSFEAPEDDGGGLGDKIKSVFTGEESALDIAVEEGQRQLAAKMQEMRHDHPEPAERKEELADWWGTHYAGQSFPDVSAERWSAVVARSDVRQTLASYEQAYSASRTANAGNPSAGADQARQALTGELYRDPYIRWHFARVREVQGNTAPRIQNLRFARESSRDGPAIAVELARALTDAGRPGEAHAVLEDMVAEFGTIDELLPHQIRVASAAGEEGRATALLAKCRAIHPTLAEECKQAHGSR